jgi:predicted regulator of Ras-like GTPase activity (Roadblock/LC7/MglB family)
VGIEGRERGTVAEGAVAAAAVVEGLEVVEDDEASSGEGVTGLVIGEDFVFEGGEGALGERIVVAATGGAHALAQAGMDEDRLAGMTAALPAMGERTSRELSRGELEQVYVRGKNGLVILMGAGAEGVLASLCTGNAKLGLNFLDMQRAAAEVANII